MGEATFGLTANGVTSEKFNGSSGWIVMIQRVELKHVAAFVFRIPYAELTGPLKGGKGYELCTVKKL
ncbi:hypothetical protein BVC80_9077g7 [Macleaya cordata]|uniref:Uncharacterized protein n=1 Tax=Macleaya cordata TaxID=56857 RepID=A0A200PLJ7_MACCD|nr:hypothetical protein BVC80_9077g7 [Macleaya cordata]